MPNILITGGTGLIGKALTKMFLEKGYEVTVLSRSVKADKSSGYENNGIVGPGPILRTAQWDINKQTIDTDAIRHADYIIHLAGAGVAEKRWSKKRKKEIVESRTLSSALLVKALHEIPNKVQAVVSASGIGWYGADPKIPNPVPFEEAAPADDDFLGETCQVWEESITPVASMGVRLVILRTGIVLSRKGGALDEFKKPVKLGVAAVLGSGKQIVSWIHVDDLCRMYLQAIEQPDWRGVYNAVAPKPVDNRALTLELAGRLKGKYYVPIYVPSFLLKIVLGELSIEVLKSATVSPKKARIAGFQFLYPSIQSALEDLLS